MEPTFEQFLSAMQGRSPAGEKQLPLMLAPEILNSPDPRAAFMTQGQKKVATPEVMGPPTPPKLSMTPAAKAALKKRVAQPKAGAAPAGPQSMSEKVSAEQAASKRPGQDLSRGQETDQRDNFNRQDREMQILQTREVTGIEPPEDDPTAFGDRLAKTHIGFEKDENGNLILKNGRPVPKFHTLLKGAIGPSVRALKGQLEDYQAAHRGIAQNADLRAKLAPYMAGQMSLTPLLSLINSSQGTNIQQDQDRAPALAQQYLKNEAGAQDDRTKLAALENKLIDQVAIPQGTVFNMGGTNTVKETAKAEPTPPAKVGKGAGTGTPKNIKAYQKEGEGIHAVLAQAKLLKQLLPRWKDFGEQSGTEQLGSIATGGLNSILPGAGDYAKQKLLGNGQRSTDQVRKTLSNLQAYLRSGKVISKEEGKRLADSLGTGTFASKEALVQGVNSLIDEMDTKLQDRAAAYPDEESYTRAHGGHTNAESAKGLELNLDEVKYKGGQPEFKIQKNPKTGARRKVYSDGRIENLP